MMKKLFAAALAMMMVLCLAACGGEKAAEAPDLNAYYTAFEESLGADNTPATMDLEGELLEGMYPGIGEYTFKQSVFKAAAMMQVGYEFALVECENESDVEAVKGIFQARQDMQIEGGAFYPAVAESWQNGEIIVNGNVVALIVAGSEQASAVSAFNELFK